MINVTDIWKSKKRTGILFHFTMAQSRQLRQTHMEPKCVCVCVYMYNTMLGNCKTIFFQYANLTNQFTCRHHMQQVCNRESLHMCISFACLKPYFYQPSTPNSSIQWWRHACQKYLIVVGNSCGIFNSQTFYFIEQENRKQIRRKTHSMPSRVTPIKVISSYYVLILGKAP